LPSRPAQLNRSTHFSPPEGVNLRDVSESLFADAKKAPQEPPSLDDLEPSTVPARAAWHRRPENQHLYTLESLNQAQGQVAGVFLDYFEADDNWCLSRQGPRPEPPLVVACGGPGTGKTHTALTAREEYRRRNKTDRDPFVYTAQNGSPASALPDGRTVQSLFCIPCNENNSEDASRKGKKKKKLNHLPPLTTAQRALLLALLDDKKALVLDEVSALDPVLLHFLHHRLCELFGNSKPFGGFAVLFLGDPFQLGPPFGSTVFQLLASLAVSGRRPCESEDPKENACYLFAKLRVVPLSAQCRAKDCPVQQDFVTTLSEWFGPTNPVTWDHVRNLRVLSPADKDFEFATVIVTGNRQRAAINLSQAKRDAARRGVPVVAWRHKLTKDAAKNFSEEDLNDLHDNYPETCGFFVLGGDAYLAENLCPRRKAANGSRAQFHSLTTDPDLPDLLKLADELAVSRGEPGEVVWVNPPLSVNVVLPGSSAADWPQKSRLPVTTDAGEVVVPVLASR
jgi:hypothetical protein